MVKVSRKDLEDVTTKVINEIKFDRDKIEQIKSNMLKHGAIRGKVQRIINGEIGLEELSENLLCLLIIYIYDATKITAVNPHQFFSKDEINRALKNDFSDNRTKHEFPVVFDGVIQVEQSDYIVLESVRNLINLYSSNLLEYNYDVTKNYKLLPDVSGDMKKVIDLNIREVKAIANKIMNNQLPLDKIVININENSRLAYNKETRKLTVFDGKIEIISGIYLLNALAHIIDSNPDFSAKVELEIKNYSKNKINKYYHQLKLKGGAN